jgi:hypothetical protein
MKTKFLMIAAVAVLTLGSCTGRNAQTNGEEEATKADSLQTEVVEGETLTLEDVTSPAAE